MSKLQVGAAKVCIDPAPDMFPFPPVWSVAKEGIAGSMHIRTLAVANEEKTILIVAFEAGSGDEALQKEISVKFNIPYENILLFSTHNHGGPPVGIGAGPMQPVGDSDSPLRMVNLVHDNAITAVEAALNVMRPARYGYGEGKSYININRDLQLEDGSWAQADNPEGFSDKTLAVVKFVDEKGNLIAALLNHCTHANTTFLGKDTDSKSKTCADFPGYTCEFLEARYGNGAVVLWSSGAAGDQNAIQCYRGDCHFTGEETVNYPDPNGMSYRYAQYLGEYHAIDADKILRKVVCDRSRMDLHINVTDIEFDVQVVPKGVSKLLNTLKAQNAIRTIKKLFPEEVRSDGTIDRTLYESIPSGEKIPCEMKLFLLGDIAIITSEAELYCKIGSLCKEQSVIRKTFLITNCSGHGRHVSYIQDDDSARNPVFQHFSTCCAGRNNEIVLNGMKDLFRKALG